VAAQILSYLALLDLGVVALLPRETAYLTGRSDGEPLQRTLPALVGRTGVIVLAQLPVVLAAAVAVLVFLPADWQPLRWPLAVVLLVFACAFPLRLFPAMLQGLQELPFLGRVQLLAWAASTVLLVALLLAGAGLYALALSAAFAQLAPVGAAWLRVRRQHHDLLPDRLRLGDRAAARAQLASSVWVSVAQIAQVLLYGTDLVIVAMVFGPAAVVPYSCTGKLVTVLANQPQLLTAAAGPALSELKAAGDRDRLFRVSSTLALATMVASGAVFCAILAINGGFVVWWVGAEQFAGIGLTILFLLNMLARHLNMTVVYTLFCFGYERRTSLVALLDGVTTIALALVLVRASGPAGALLGLTASATLVALPINLHALSREVGVPVLGFAAVLWPWAWRFAAVAAAAGILLARAVPPRFFPLAGAGSLVLLVYAAVMWPVVLRGPLGGYTRPILAAGLARIWNLRPGSRREDRARVEQP